MKVKNNKGSITIFVLVGLLFMTSFLVILYANNLNKSKIIKERFNIISGIYSPNESDEQSYTDAYTALRKKNAQTLTASVDNNSTIELTKTFEDKVSNYRIYGSSEGVGNKIENIFDADNIINNNNSTISRVEFNGKDCITWVQGINTGTQKILEGKFKENTVYCISGYMASSITSFGYLNVIYTDGSSELIKILRSEGGAVVAGEFKKILFNIGNENKTISYIQGVHSSGERIYLDIATFQIVDKDDFLENQYIETEKFIILVKVSGKNLVNIPNMNIKVDSWYYKNYFPDNPKIVLEANTTYTLSFDYVINSSTTNKIYCSVGYGTERYVHDIAASLYYVKQNEERCVFTFTTPATFDSSYTPYLQLRFVRADVTGDFDVNISNVNFELGSQAKEYEPYQGSQEFNLFLNAPLKEGEYLDFKSQKVVRIDGTEEYIELPELSTYEDYTKIRVLTEVVPTKIEVEYVGYTLE